MVQHVSADVGADDAVQLDSRHLAAGVVRAVHGGSRGSRVYLDLGAVDGDVFGQRREPVRAPYAARARHSVRSHHPTSGERDVAVCSRRQRGQVAPA